MWPLAVRVSVRQHKGGLAMSFWKRIFGGQSQLPQRMLDHALEGDKLPLEIIRQIAAGTKPSVIVDHLALSV